MAYYLRIVKASFFSDRHFWRSPDDVPDFAVRFFRNDADELSLFYIEGEQQVSRVVAAFAAADRERIKARDVIYVAEEHVELEDMSLTATDGGLPDAEVSGWHRTLSGLTEAKSRRLAFHFGSRGFCHNYSRSEVCELIAQAVAAGFMGEGAFSDRVAGDLAKYRQAAGE